ncbi:unnamed protein product [Gongylonema pulchrum]|uniref:Anoctamin n=1 Tax=Gongylonema pulchrum TaxID=637853 RepID=A0A183DAE9_9BILA|nr:unnamed protein product [Gongylonema pulchrum]
MCSDFFFFQNLKSNQMYGPLFRTFRGLILTGWQRYDHFAVLCEILPVGLPSAVMNLMIAESDEKSSAASILRRVADTLNCTSKISIESVSSFSFCEFPGSELFYAIHVTLRERIEAIEAEVFEHQQVKGWLGRFNVRHNYTQLWYLLQLESIITSHFEGMLEVVCAAALFKAFSVPTVLIYCAYVVYA